MTAVGAGPLVDVLEELPPGVVRREPGEVARDWWPIGQKRAQWGREAALPELVLSPSTHDELVSCLSVLARAGVPVTPYGLGSSVVGGAAATPGAVTVETSRMLDILDLDEISLAVTVQAGLRGSDLEDWLNERGLTCGHYPQSMALSTVGGWVATRASGTFSGKYGNIENLVLGLRWVAPDGTPMEIKAVPRRSTGPDLRALLLGSEGMLGVLSEVTLQVHRLPAERRLDSYLFPDVATGLDAVRELQHADLAPALVRLYDHADAERFGLDAGTDPHAALLVVGWDGPIELVDVQQRLVRHVLVERGGTGLGDGPGKAWFERRFDVGALERAIAGDGTVGDTIEVAFPWRTAEAAYRAVMAVFANRGVRATGHFSHVYRSGTSLYVTFFLGPASDADLEALYVEVWDAVMAATLEHAGTVSHHHGIGRIRTPWAERELGSAWPVLIAVRDALDPARRFNPELFTA